MFAVLGNPDHGGMTDSELIRRAENAGIAASYENWRHDLVEVPAETLRAILDVLGDDAPDATSGARGAAGEQEGSVAGPSERGAVGERRARTTPAADSERTQWPGTHGRQWGFTVQLYSIRSRDSWGHGDLHDLAELAQWSATEYGAGFVLVNPLHAVEPVPPISASPYLPMTRLFTSPLYLRVEDIPEYWLLSEAEHEVIQLLAAPLKYANTTADLIDRNEVWTAKRAALDLLYNVPMTAARQEIFAAYRAERDPDLRLWSAWCALAEQHGPDWRRWPAEVADSSRAEAAVSNDPVLARSADFHAWLQWLTDEQLAAAQATAKRAGMAHGIIHDLAVGVHPGGADAWAHPELLVPGFSVGAPPDSFNQLGQDWGQPPWHPRHLAAAGYEPLANLFGATLRHGGGLRVDHVMGLMRLWWIPAGQSADLGAYVRYNHRASVPALAEAAANTGAVAIGEDLGTVDPWISDYLASQGILGTMMLWFATDPNGGPLPPARWRTGCMATVGTHDVPPVSAFVSGDQVTVRARLGLLNIPEERERAESEAALARWHAAVQAEGLLPAGPLPTPAEFTVALYGYVAKTPALLIGVSLADAVGETRAQNIPGTSDEYPNWQIPLCDADQQPVLLEDLPAIGLVRDVCQAVRS